MERRWGMVRGTWIKLRYGVWVIGLLLLFAGLMGYLSMVPDVDNLVRQITQGLAALMTVSCIAFLLIKQPFR